MLVLLSAISKSWKKRLGLLFISLGLLVVVAFANPGSFEAISSGAYETPASLFLKKVIEYSKVTVIAASPVKPLEALIASSVFLGALASCTPIAVFFYRYFMVDPDFTEEERKMARVLLLAPPTFTAFTLLGFFIISPASIRVLMFFADIAGVEPVLTLGDVVHLVIYLSLACGLLSLTPIVVYILVQLNMIDANWLASNRLIVYPILMFVAFALSPGSDPVSNTVFFAIPALGIELAIKMAKKREKQKLTSSPP